MAIAESNVYGLWVAKQTAKGTPAVTATKKLIQVGGNVGMARTDGSENWSDGDRFGDSTDYVDSLAGNGAPVIEAQPDSLAYLLWLYFGAEVVTGTTTKTHVFTPGVNGGFYTTWWKRVGLSMITRQKFNDMCIGGIRLEGSTANKIVKLTPTTLGMDPGEVFASDPVAVVSKGVPGTPSDNLPFLYTEGKGAYNIDGTVFTGHTQFAIVVEDALSPVPGDDVVAYDFVPGVATVRLEAITLVLDTASAAQYNKIIYGTASPAPGAKPIRSLAGQALGSYSADLTRNGVGAAALQRCLIEVPGVKWTPDMDIAPAPDGGPIELALAGGMRKVTANPQVRFTINNDQAAYTV